MGNWHADVNDRSPCVGTRSDVASEPDGEQTQGRIDRSATAAGGASRGRDRSNGVTSGEAAKKTSPMMERLGKLLARVPIDSHELGDLISVEERVEAIEAKLDSLVARVKQLEKT